MKIFNASQVKLIDTYTIAHEPIASHALMERAASKCSAWISRNFSRQHTFRIFCGFGNNGGDGMAIARQLAGSDYSVEAFFIDGGKNLSPDCAKNLELLQNCNVRLTKISSKKQLPQIDHNDVVVDAIFGAGLNRPLDGIFAETITHLNGKKAIKIAIDIPSGMPDEGIVNELIAFEADYTLTFQFPFVSFFIAENAKYVGHWEVLNIGLHPQAISNELSNYSFTECNNIKLINRDTAGHKGTFGHALIIAGSKGMAGAAILSAKACLKSGCGLVTTHIPESLLPIMHTTFPEALVSPDKQAWHIAELPYLEKYDAIAIGPGLGNAQETVGAFKQLINLAKCPLVIDADGLNILAANSSLLNAVPENTILTPHPGEFDRLFGKSANNYDRLLLQQACSRKYKIIIVLKGRYTSVSNTDGQVYFNCTGNNGMATAGSGDVLTGMITSMLAQGYGSLQAAVNAVFLHGLAGDLAASNIGEHALIASDIIENIGKAYLKVNETSIF